MDVYRVLQQKNTTTLHLHIVIMLEEVPGRLLEFVGSSGISARLHPR